MGEMASSKNTAKAIIDQAWRNAGYTEEDLQEEEKILRLFDMMVGEGVEPGDILAAWESKQPYCILRERCDKPPVKPLDR